MLQLWLYTLSAILSNFELKSSIMVHFLKCYGHDLWFPNLFWAPASSGFGQGLSHDRDRCQSKSFRRHWSLVRWSWPRLLDVTVVTRVWKPFFTHFQSPINLNGYLCFVWQCLVKTLHLHHFTLPKCAKQGSKIKLRDFVFFKGLIKVNLAFKI